MALSTRNAAGELHFDKTNTHAISLAFGHWPPLCIAADTGQPRIDDVAYSLGHVRANGPCWRQVVAKSLLALSPDTAHAKPMRAKILIQNSYPSVLARYAVMQVHEGRRVGGTLNTFDVLSRYRIYVLSCCRHGRPTVSIARPLLVAIAIGSSAPTPEHHKPSERASRC